MKTYGSTEIQRLAKISKMQAIHWTQMQAVIPYKDAKGRGSRRIYSWQNLVEMMICRELQKYSIETHVMVKMLEYLRTPSTDMGGISFWELLKQEPETDQVFLVYLPYQLKSGEIIHAGHGILRLRDVKSLLGKGLPSAIIINVRALINEVGGP